MGVEVALIERGRVSSHGFGATREGGPAPDERTVFEIGSVTRTFTGLLLADLVDEGRVRLDQPVAELLPSGVRVPDYQGQPITLVDLATHTSGLPRLPANLLEQLSLPGYALDPYAHYSEADLFEFLASYQLEAAPGTVEEYSNLGFGLLGYALSRADGTSYANAVERRITAPLGMLDTAIALTGEQRARFASGHSPDLETQPEWTFQAPTEGAGALRSTARDMATYLMAQRAAPPSGEPDAGTAENAERAALRRSIELTHQVFRTRDGALQNGLGWSVWPELELVLHNGGTGGFDSFVLFDKRYDLGVVVLSNTRGYDRFTDSLGFALLTLLYGGEPAPLALPASLRLSDAELERLVGAYTYGEHVLELSQNGRRIDATIDAADSYRVFPSASNILNMRDPANGGQPRVVLRFGPENAQRYDHVSIEQEGESTLATRR